MKIENEGRGFDWAIDGFRHAGVDRHTGFERALLRSNTWIPACAGMTEYQFDFDLERDWLASSR